MKIKLLRACHFSGVRHEIGDVLELDWRLANELIHVGKAAAHVEPEPVAPATDPEPAAPAKAKPKKGS